VRGRLTEKEKNQKNCQRGGGTRGGESGRPLGKKGLLTMGRGKKYALVRTGGGSKGGALKTGGKGGFKTPQAPLYRSADGRRVEKRKKGVKWEKKTHPGEEMRTKGGPGGVKVAGGKRERYGSERGGAKLLS